MKRTFTCCGLGLLLGLVAPLFAHAQAPAGVGIGTTTPAASAALEIQSTTQGLLLPRLSLSQRQALGTGGIAAPVAGLVIYQTDNTPGLYAYDGTSWVRLGADNLGSHTATQALNLQSQALTGTGADLGTAVGVGVRADGGLNLGQNTAGNNLNLGYQAGQALTTGSGNVLLGYQAGQATTTGNLNQFIGYQAGQFNTSGSNNLFSGYRSGYANTTGSFNLFSGTNSGLANTSGQWNLFLGYDCGQANTTGDDNLFSGYASGYSNTTGSRNLFSGSYSGFYNTSGSNNLFSGSYSGFYNTSGSNNLFSGSYSGASNTTGSDNLFSGSQSGYSNTTGSRNQFSGYQSGFYNTTGDDNSFSGPRSGYFNRAGSHNQFSGYLSGYYNTTGNDNSFNGYQSGYFNETGSNNTALGANAGPDSGSPALTNATALGANAVVSQSNSVVLGNNASVGIGTPAPTQKLDVVGHIQISGAGNGLKFPDNTTQTTAATDAQQLSLSGSTISLTNGGSVAIPGDDLGNHTATQPLNLSNNQLLGVSRLNLLAGADAGGAGDLGAVAFQYRSGGGFTHWLRSRHNSAVTGAGNALDFYLNSSPTATGSSAPGTGNAQVLTLESYNSQPRVGIGTDVPAATLDVEGSLALRPAATMALTADNQAVPVGSRSYLRLASDNTTASTRTITLGNGSQAGQLLYIEGANTVSGAQFELLDAGNANLTGTIIMTFADVLTLLWNGSQWLQVGFVNN